MDRIKRAVDILTKSVSRTEITEALALLNAFLADMEQEPTTNDCDHMADREERIIEGAVFWNPYSKVFQCHRCGQTFVPKQAAQEQPDDFVEVLEGMIQEGYKERDRFPIDHHLWERIDGSIAGKMQAKQAYLTFRAQERARLVAELEEK